MPSAAEYALERELEPQEEEKEDDPELGDERGHFRRLDEAELARLVRTEQKAGEQIGRDRGKAEPPGKEPEPGKNGNGQGELAERHGSTADAMVSGRRTALTSGRSNQHDIGKRVEREEDEGARAIV